MDLKLNYTTHDILIEDNDFVLTQVESESLKQRLIVKLYTWFGEWFLNVNEGTPWRQSILGKNRSKQTIDSILIERITSEPEVEQLVSFTSSIDNQYRIYSMNFVVKSSNNQEQIPIELQLDV